MMEALRMTETRELTATVKALKAMRTPEQVAALRGKSVAEILK